MEQDHEIGSAATGEDTVAGPVFGQTEDTATGGAKGARAEWGLGALAAGVVKDLQDLVRGEVQLAKTELREEAKTAAGGATSIAAGAAAGSLGVVFLMLALTELLSRRMPRWAAAGIVGLGLTGAAAALGLGGKSRLSAASLTPKQTLQSLRENAAWAKERLGSGAGQ